MSDVVEIHKRTNEDGSKYLILNSMETEVSGNLTVLEDLDVCGNIYFNNRDLSSVLANLEVDLTGGQDASFSNLDISGSLKLNNIDISGKLIQIDASLVEIATNSGGGSGPEYVHYVTGLTHVNHQIGIVLGQTSTYNANDVAAQGGSALIPYAQNNNPVTLHTSGRFSVNTGMAGVYKIEGTLCFDMENDEEAQIEVGIFTEVEPGMVVGKIKRHVFRFGHSSNSLTRDPINIPFVTTLTLDEYDFFYIQGLSNSALLSSEAGTKIKFHGMIEGSYATQAIITRLNAAPPPSSWPPLWQPSNSFDFRSASIQTDGVVIDGTHVGFIVRYDGTTSHETTVSSTNGLVGSTNEYFKFNPTWALKANADDSVSIEMFFKLTTESGNTEHFNSIINFYNGNVDGGGVNAHDHFVIERQASTNNIDFYTKSAINNTPTDNFKLTTNESDIAGMDGTDFAHMVFVYEHNNGGKRHIYVNGVETINSVDDDGLWSYIGSHSHMILGRTSYLQNDNGIEYIQYFRHYNYALSPYKITSLYNNRYA